MEKLINSRIIHKHDTEEGWNKNINFIPKLGELIIYDIDSTYSYTRMKIGDGINSVENLPFHNYSDLYYSKAEIDTFINEIKNKNEEDIPENGIETEYIYTYDGDNTTDNNKWVTNYGDLKVFVRLGDVPKGTLKLVGAEISVINPSNQWLNHTLTITEEHLNNSLEKSGEIIPATQPGLIQIFHQHLSDFSPFTILCVCTKAGWYNVTFDDWFEIINFPETGIYGYDKRSYGGNEYVSQFKFTAITSATGNNSNNDTDIPTHYQGNEISMFSRGICIGDSVTEGSFDNADGGAIVKRFSYPAILERITGVDIVNAGIAGMTSQTWYEASLNSDVNWGKWVNQEWVWNMYPENSGNDIISSQLDYSGFDFAIIHLGINDLAPVYDGSKTIEEVVANFEVYINTIITTLKNANTGIVVFLATIVPSYAQVTNPTYQTLNSKIREIAEATDSVYLMDLNTFSELASKPEYNVTHPTALGYHKLANEIKAYISFIINKNMSDFTNVQFINL